TFIGAIGFSRFSHKKAQLEAIEQNITKNNPKISNYLVKAAELDAVNKQIKILQDEQDKSVSSISILTELSKIIPDNTYLTDFVITNKSEDKSNGRQLIISGYSKASSTLIEIMEHSSIFEGVEFIAPIITEVKGERFMIKAMIVDSEDDVDKKMQKDSPVNQNISKKDSVNNTAGKKL
ncbi:MAG: PilN domain-containing protein, partial [Nitrospirae bacterium]|nr:PilN domain-containing protein [Nitrospirota bacterium]